MGNILVSAETPLLPLDGSVAGGCVTVVWFGIVLYLIIRWVVIEPWGAVAVSRSMIRENEVRRQKRFALARSRCEDLDENVRNEVLALSLEDLREALQKDRFNAQTVLKAYAFKALAAQDEINCLAEFIVESFERAEKLDAQFSGKPNKPPLYGLPFSVKGNFFVKGYECCIGLAKFLDEPAKEDCTFIASLADLGAIPFVTTNIPQGLLGFLSSNSVYGTTKNPLNPKRTPGGSSGGEAALLAYGGTPFATGSDLAGSIRIPSSFCGVVGLKPTQDRLTARHTNQGVPGRGRMTLAYGFITKTVDHQIQLLSETLNHEELHKSCPTAVPLPIKLDVIKETVTKKMRIGYFSNDGFLRPAPGMERAVLDTVEKLKADGHDLVKFILPTPLEAAELTFKALMFDGGKYQSKFFRGEVVDPYMTTLVRLINTPLWLRSFASRFVGLLSPQAAIMARSYTRSVEDLRQNQALIDEYQVKIIDQWNELGLDAVICPAFPHPACEHHWPSYLGASGFSTGLWNLINFPAGVVPTGEWSEEDENALDTVPIGGLADNEKQTISGYNFVSKFVRDASRDSVGLPLSVQIVARPYEEEKCLGVMKIVEGLWKTVN